MHKSTQRRPPLGRSKRKRPLPSQRSTLEVEHSHRLTTPCASGALDLMLCKVTRFELLSSWNETSRFTIKPHFDMYRAHIRALGGVDGSRTHLDTLVLTPKGKPPIAYPSDPNPILSIKGRCGLHRPLTSLTQDESR